MQGYQRQESEDTLVRLSTSESVPRSDVIETSTVGSAAPSYYQEHVDAADFNNFKGAETVMNPVTNVENSTAGGQEITDLQQAIIDDVRAQRYAAAKEKIDILSRSNSGDDAPPILSSRVKTLFRNERVIYDPEKRAYRPSGHQPAPMRDHIRNAIRSNDNEVLLVLGDSVSAAINDKDRIEADDYLDWTLLAYAARIGSKDCLLTLLRKGADPNEEFELRHKRHGTISRLRDRKDSDLDNGFLTTALHAAIVFGNIGAVKILLGHGAKPDATNQNLRRTPLHLAVRWCRKRNGAKYFNKRPMEIAAELLKHNSVSINAEDEQGETPLHLGLIGNGLKTGEFVDFMVAHGADVNVTNRLGWTPLMIHAGVEVVEGHDLVHFLRNTRPGDSEDSDTAALIRHGADVSLAALDDGRTALHIASGAGNWKRVVELINAGAQVNGRTSKGTPPLTFAVLAGKVTTVRTLIDRGADVNYATKNGQYPTIVFEALATNSGSGGLNEHTSAELLRTLIKSGAEVSNHRDSQGNTPLHRVAASGNSNCCEILLSEGKAFPNPKNNDGFTPLRLAKKKNLTMTIAVLKKYGGKT